jgi:predicted neutral ceramidase superfamily lipid hydrolase
MISEKDIAFLQYWEQVREKENTFTSKISRGLPMAFLFALPIILSVIVVRLFAPNWYTKISSTSPGSFITILFATSIIIVFYAYFRMQYKWEMNEQLYNEIKSKKNKIDNQTNIN